MPGLIITRDAREGHNIVWIGSTKVTTINVDHSGVVFLKINNDSGLRIENNEPFKIDDAIIRIFSVSNGQYSMQIDAPQDVKILRDELVRENDND